MSRLALILLLGVLPHLAEARLFKLWTPDVLLPLSSVVCNGVVTKLDKLGEQTPNSLSSVEHWKAHIKVLSTYKGQAASEIDLLYDNTFGAVNGPINFSLKEGHRYRFYLNPGPRGAFITALDANIDNRWAVESLDADEPDSSPPLLMKEAQNLADAYFRKFRSDSNDVQSDRYDPYYYVFKNQNQAGLMPNVWYFNYSYFPTPMNKRQFLADAQIYVRGDRTIDPMTWIAARPAMKPGEILTADIGKEVRLDVAQVRNRFVRGLLESITDQKIRLKDPHNESDDSIADAGYFKHDLNTIWILEPTSK